MLRENKATFAGVFAFLIIASLLNLVIGVGMLSSVVIAGIFAVISGFITFKLSRSE